MRKGRLILTTIVTVAVLSLIALFYCDKQVASASDNRTFYDVAQVPHRHVGLLLGTAKYVSGGRLNLYYQYRIRATIALMKAGKIDKLVISGDNSRKDYNEPEMMRADLVAAGIDSNNIFLDYAGFRTFDSMIRLREIFSQDAVTVISQKFHNQRALFIAQREGIDAVGFNAEDVSNNAGFKTNLREKFARVKVYVDYVLGVEPKFLGPKVLIP